MMMEALEKANKASKIFLLQKNKQVLRDIHQHLREIRLITLSNIHVHNDTIASIIATDPIPILNQRERKLGIKFLEQSDPAKASRRFGPIPRTGISMAFRLAHSHEV
mmetsp:Transcript_27303/g.58678  ORF Transcript_27303/g.58678 Transcript_27303/m.58678 type:complete len:107 (+) Transcript_27303:136-456(+)